MASVSHIYYGVFFNGSVDRAQEEDPPLISDFFAGKEFTKLAEVQVDLW